MSLAIIRKAFEDKLKDYAITQTLPVSYEGKSFTPPTTGKYLKCYVLPAPTDSNTLEGTDREFSGVFQVTVVQPVNTATGELTRIAGELDALYPPYFTQDGLAIWMTQPMSGGRVIPDGVSNTMVVFGNYKALSL